jgi:hypothetical protein
MEYTLIIAQRRAFRKSGMKISGAFYVFLCQKTGLNPMQGACGIQAPSRDADEIF